MAASPRILRAVEVTPNNFPPMNAFGAANRTLDVGVQHLVVLDAASRSATMNAAQSDQLRLTVATEAARMATPGGSDLRSSLGPSPRPMGGDPTFERPWLDCCRNGARLAGRSHRLESGLQDSAPLH
jgi:hypothetical protein